jgi:glycosyltransferase involved in cell wall biosynthesis
VVVQVLLSTYNGAAYLKPQIVSLLEQDHAPVKILVRDDGSADGTIALLRDFHAAYPHIEVVYGANVGFAQSFLELLRLSSPTADYVAFCDQDDVWHPGKVSRATQILKPIPQDTPTLYSSCLTVTDEHLNALGQSRIPTKELSFRNALVECPTPGPTMVMNQAARRLLLQGIPRNIYSHDWWTYLVVSAFGRIIFDEEPSLLYRQHASNVFGTRVGFIRRLGFKMRRFWSTGKRQPVIKQAEEFNRLYGAAMSVEQRWTAERFVESSRKGFWGRLCYACSCDVYRQTAFDNLVLRVLISLKRL